MQMLCLRCTETLLLQDKLQRLGEGKGITECIMSVSIRTKNPNASHSSTKPSFPSLFSPFSLHVAKRYKLLLASVSYISLAAFTHSAVQSHLSLCIMWSLNSIFSNIHLDIYCQVFSPKHDLDQMPNSGLVTVLGFDP